jgi:hypothetical protein
MSEVGPPPEGPRFSKITSDDHAGFLWIATALGVSYIGLSGILRLFLRHRNFGLDGAAVALATVCLSSLDPIIISLELRSKGQDL